MADSSLFGGAGTSLRLNGIVVIRFRQCPVRDRQLPFRRSWYRFKSKQHCCDMFQTMSSSCSLFGGAGTGLRLNGIIVICFRQCPVRGRQLAVRRSWYRFKTKRQCCDMFQTKPCSWQTTRFRRSWYRFKTKRHCCDMFQTKPCSWQTTRCSEELVPV